MKKSIVILFVFSCLFVNAQTVQEVDTTQIPSEIAYKGNVHSAVSWSEKNGEHYVIQTETDLLTPKNAVEAAKMGYELRSVNGKTDTIHPVEAEYRIKGLFAYHYLLQKDNSPSLVWRNIDQVSDCSFRNLTAEYLTQPIITDLDNDGKAETWLVYQLGCRNEPSVALGMKIILYFGEKNYVLRGLRLVHHEGKTDGGEMRADNSWLELPSQFRDYVLELWEKYKTEK